MVLATHRPAELVLTRHPLRPVSLRLLTSRRAVEITLDELAADAVGAYLAQRFPGHAFPRDLAGLVRARTDGNALFLVALVDQLVADGVIAKRGGGTTAERLRRDVAAFPKVRRARTLGRTSAAAKAERAALADLPATFHEGHGTRDVQEAQRVLASVSARRS